MNGWGVEGGMEGGAGGGGGETQELLSRRWRLLSSSSRTLKISGPPGSSLPSSATPSRPLSPALSSSLLRHAFLSLLRFDSISIFFSLSFRERAEGAGVSSAGTLNPAAAEGGR